MPSAWLLAFALRRGHQANPPLDLLLSPFLASFDWGQYFDRVWGLSKSEHGVASRYPTTQGVTLILAKS